MTWEEPKNWTEWLERFVEVQADLDAIEVPEPLACAPGQILFPHEINAEFPKVENAFKDLGEVKDKCNHLINTAERWYDLEMATKMLEARGLESCPNQKLQQAHAITQTIESRKRVDAAKLLRDAIHDERSRLWQYRDTLINMGHNARKEFIEDT